MTYALQFAKPTLANKTAVLEFRRAFLTGYQKTAIAGSTHLENFDDKTYPMWLDYLNAPAGTNLFGYDKVDSSNYLAMLGDRVVGMVSIRYELTPQLQQVGGHVGYSTHPDYQGQGVATAMLNFAVQNLAGLGVTKVLVTCDDTNLGSAKVIEKNGGVLENIITLSNKKVCRYWIDVC